MYFDYTQQLQKVFTIQKKIQDIHPLLEKVFPIVIAKEGLFLIYDQKNQQDEYQLVKEVPTPWPIPGGVRAAFPLEEYDNRIVCVVTEDVFEEPAGYAVIFHEFIHCQQYETCEPDLKAALAIAQEAKANNDGMWEINYTFPYSNPEFVKLYEEFLSAKERKIPTIRTELKKVLSPKDYEYMLWQEWKEGFARWMENQIRDSLGYPLSAGKVNAPFNRVSFYAGGELLINFLTQQTPELRFNLQSLFHQMFILPEHP